MPHGDDTANVVLHQILPNSFAFARVEWEDQILPKTWTNAKSDRMCAKVVDASTPMGLSDVNARLDTPWMVLGLCVWTLTSVLLILGYVEMELVQILLEGTNVDVTSDLHKVLIRFVLLT